MKEALHMTGMHVTPEVAASLCQVHTMPPAELLSKLLDMMRARHGKGGLNVCTPCVERAKAEADRRRGRAPS